jgi:sugar O-acyltransferase (sialic acid O-acetyltransferase NeuD family)
MMKKVLILGGLGNGSVIANAIKEANMHGYNDYQCVGFLNDHASVGEKIDDFPVLGAVQNIKKFIEEGYYFINTILRIDGQKERLDMFKKLDLPEERLATFVHPSSYIAPNVNLYPGSVIMPHVAISSGTSIGKGSLIMVGATIGHDNIIGDYCHIAAQACVGAYLKIGIGVHIGLNATIREHLTIGEFSTIGMGAVLTKDVGENEIWVGNPAMLLRMAK